MIKVALDEAVVFDTLTILLIKTKMSAEMQHTKNYLNFVADIKDEIGLEKLYSVMNSPEFEKLRAANQKTFDLVSLAKDDKCLASDVDKANYQRYLCKKALQDKHFNNKLTEEKLGYV